MFLEFVDFLSISLLFVPSFLIFISSLYIFNIFDSFNINLNNKDIGSVFYSVCVYLLSGVFIFYFYQTQITPKTILFIHSILLFITFSLFFLYYKKFILNKKKINAIVISDKPEATELVRFISNSKSNIVFSFNFNSNTFSQNIKDKEDLYKLISLHNINSIIMDFDRQENIHLINDIYHKYFNKIKVFSFYDFYEIVFKKIIPSQIDYVWYYKSARLDDFFYKILKRIIDLIMCVPVFIILLIIHPFVYFKIKKEMKMGYMNSGSILYKHKRIGLNCKVFTAYQYRSMKYADNKQAWPGEKDNENVVTPFGAMLRRTRIDALPQVWNVLKGEQSFIGPRPDAEFLYERLVSNIPYYNIRYSVLPGLSGWAQISKNVPHNLEENKERFASDLFYIKNRSIILDVLIILRTIKIVLLRTGK